MEVRQYADVVWGCLVSVLSETPHPVQHTHLSVYGNSGGTDLFLLNHPQPALGMCKALGLLTISIMRQVHPELRTLGFPPVNLELKRSFGRVNK